MNRQRLAAIPLWVAIRALRVAKRIHPREGSILIRHATEKANSALDSALERGLYSPATEPPAFVDMPPAFEVARAQYPGKPLERCSCGCLKPKGGPCPNRIRA